jgi:hypothetical protein
LLYCIIYIEAYSQIQREKSNNESQQPSSGNIMATPVNSGGTASVLPLPSDEAKQEVRTDKISSAAPDDGNGIPVITDEQEQARVRR